MATRKTTVLCLTFFILLHIVDERRALRDEKTLSSQTTNLADWHSTWLS